MVNRKITLLTFLGIPLVLAVYYWNNQTLDYSQVSAANTKTDSSPADSSLAITKLEASRKHQDVSILANTGNMEQLNKIGQDMQQMQVVIAQLAKQQQQLFQLVEELTKGELSQQDVDQIETKGVDPYAGLSERQKIEQENKDQIYLLDQTMANQDVDKEWSEQMLDDIYQGFQNDSLSDIRVLEASCASTVCKLQLQMQGDNRRESMNNLAFDRPWNGPTYVDTQEGGRVLIYLAREGHQLPAL